MLRWRSAHRLSTEDGSWPSSRRWPGPRVAEWGFRSGQEIIFCAGDHQGGPARLMAGMETTALIDGQPTLLLTLAEVAAHLRCTRRSIERQVAKQRLRVVHIGRAVRVERSELDRYVRSLRVGDDGG